MQTYHFLITYGTLRERFLERKSVSWGLVYTLFRLGLSVAAALVLLFVDYMRLVRRPYMRRFRLFVFSIFPFV